MNLYEYQGKELLKSCGGNIQRGFVISNVEEAINSAKKLHQKTGTKSWVMKAQIYAGGRGKSGGIKLAKSLEEVEDIALKMLGMRLITPQTDQQGQIVKKIMITEDLYDDAHIQEYYISILLDRASGKNIIMYSNEGGVDIETISKYHPKKIHIEFIDPILGIQNFQFRKIAFQLQLDIKIINNFIEFLTALYKAYTQYNALLFEINPLIKTSNNQFIAVDTKVILDDNAIIKTEYDHQTDHPIELAALKCGLKYIPLDGNVACMVNGAGLAMATMDMIKLSGGKPANFLDIGGTADVKRVTNALTLILQDNNIKVILINIFGGIVRCERVAFGIINAYSIMNKNKTYIPPIIIRLQGTNFQYAKKLLDDSKIIFYSVNTLEEAAKKINKILYNF